MIGASAAAGGMAGLLGVPAGETLQVQRSLCAMRSSNIVRFSSGRGRLDQDGFGSSETYRGEVHVPELRTRLVQDRQGRRCLGALQGMAT